MRKKLAIILLIGVVLSITACGNNTTDKENLSTENQSAVIQQEPDEATVYDMVESFYWFVLNAVDEGVTIIPDNNQACELGACAVFWQTNQPWHKFTHGKDVSVASGYIIPEPDVSDSLRNRFGSEYSLRDFSNTYDSEGEITSALTDNDPLYMFFCKIGNEYEYTLLSDISLIEPTDTIISNISESSINENGYNAEVEYQYRYYENAEEYIGQRTVWYELISDNNSDYGWVIERITFGDFENPIS